MTCEPVVVDLILNSYAGQSTDYGNQSGDIRPVTHTIHTDTHTIHTDTQRGGVELQHILAHIPSEHPKTQNKSLEITFISWGM